MLPFSEEEILEFKIELLDMLNSSKKSLLAIEGAADYKSSFDNVFRGFHNIKGAAGMMELTELQTHTHELESILMNFKSAESLPRNYISFFLSGIDAAKKILNGESGNFNYKVSLDIAVEKEFEVLHMSQRLNVVTQEIQDLVVKTRMQPIGNVLTKFYHVVRDLSQELKKTIYFHFTGADIQLDKALLDAIKDPLNHIIRNSCDHGIEASELRVASGKPEFGTVNVVIYHECGQVIIEISDDGKGLDKEKIIAKAIEKNIITANRAASLSDKQIYELIFAPGLSTASSVTNVSGRGVGMDVVRSNIEKIGGAVELSGEPGRGMNIKLKIPQIKLEDKSSDSSVSQEDKALHVEDTSSKRAS